jgi:hypothetical protein
VAQPPDAEGMQLLAGIKSLANKQVQQVIFLIEKTSDLFAKLA